MKRFYSLLLLAFMAVAANAQIYYLLPGTQDVTTENVTNAYDYLPLEDGSAKYKAPERLAYDWFKGKYGKDKFITIKDVNDGKLEPSVVSVLWVNVDRVDLALEGDEGFDAKFTKYLKDALATYVKAGGNVYLTKQATRLSKEMGRATWWPSDYKSNEYVEGSDAWYLQTQFSTGYNIDHVIFKGLRDWDDTEKKYTSNTFALIDSETHPYQRTDNNCAWGDWSIYAPENTGESDAARRSGFENAQKCRILGGWGHTSALQYAGMVEFYPKDEWKGTVIAQGLAAYQWSETNKYESNVEKLTENTLNYLKGSALWNEGKTPADGVAGTESETGTYEGRCGSKYDNYTCTLSSDNTYAATIDQDGKIHYNNVGTANIIAKYVGDGVNSCKTEITITAPINVNYMATGTRDVTIERSFTKDTKSTVCFPFAISNPSQYGTFYAFKGFDGANITFESVDATEANTPYMFKPNADYSSLTFNNVEVVKSSGAKYVVNNNYCEFAGTYNTEKLENANANGYYAYTFKKVGDVDAGVFATTTGTITIDPTRAFVHVSSNGARLNAIFDDGEVTSISVINGEVIESAPIYTVAGQRVSNAYKGIFICNGKKFVK